jgi:N-methylhydantoinase A
VAGPLRVGVDIGGTFTDLCVLDDDGIVAVGKVLTTPEEPARAVEEVLRGTVRDRGLDPADVTSLIHGTTLVTNALIERRGASTALLTTEGFRDVLEMAREHRYELYDLGIELPRPLVPRHLRHGVAERTLADGTVERSVDVDQVRRLARELVEVGVEAVAVCFLHSHVDDTNERAAREAIAEVAPGLRVALSSDINPEIREYERSSTTVANVYVQGIVEGYLDDLRTRTADVGVRRPPLIMLSNGGVATLDVARRHPIRMLESGPAGGALGAVAFGAGRGIPDLMAFDMGGTTAKLSVIEDGRPLVTHTFEVARLYRMRPGSGLPVRAPVLDMIEIGAGGGSIATVDPLGLVTVGPQSAGSEPGPVCYGRGGTRATVTDADLVLGYLGAGSFLGGAMPLDLEAAREAIRTQVAEPMGIDVEQAAWGIHATVNENMANAARVHAVERGRDVARLPLFASGGNGPLHGPGLARALGSPAVLVPPAAGVLSALGFLSAPLSIDLVQSAHARLGELTTERALGHLEQLRTEAEKVLTESGVPAEEVTHEHGCDMRFVGQGTETTVTVPAEGTDWVARAEAAFRSAYEARFGTVAPRDVEVEILTWRVHSRGRDPEARLRFAPRPEGDSRTGSRQAWFPSHGYVEAAVHDRYLLRPGSQLLGPALVEERESTLVVPPGARCTVGDDSAILLELEATDDDA